MKIFLLNVGWNSFSMSEYTVRWNKGTFFCYAHFGPCFDDSIGYVYLPLFASLPILSAGHIMVQQLVWGSRLIPWLCRIRLLSRNSIWATSTMSCYNVDLIRQPSDWHKTCVFRDYQNQATLGNKKYASCCLNGIPPLNTALRTASDIFSVLQSNHLAFFHFNSSKEGPCRTDKVHHSTWKI